MSTSLPGSFRSCYNDDDIDFQSLHEEDTDGASGNTRANHADQLYNPAPQEPPIHEQVLVMKRIIDIFVTSLAKGG